MHRFDDFIDGRLGLFVDRDDVRGLIEILYDMGIRRDGVSTVNMMASALEHAAPVIVLMESDRLGTRDGNLGWLHGMWKDQIGDFGYEIIAYPGESFFKPTDLVNFDDFFAMLEA